jgi:hypothetical protein
MSGDDWVCALVAVGTAAAGQPCVVRSSVASEMCAPGLWCDVVDNGSGTCAEPIVPGGACDDPDDVCRDHLVCLVDETGVGTCGAVTLVDTVGGSCTRQVAPPFRLCDISKGLYCENSACIELGDGSPGSRCALGDAFEGLCGEGLYCGGDDTAPTCAAQLEPGAACDNSRACAYGCDYSSNTCAPQYCQAN